MVMSVSDVQVMECLMRPYIVKVSNMAVPNVGVATDELVEDCAADDCHSARSLRTGGTASVGTCSMWTAQPSNKIPGHTGYLTTATRY